MITATQLITAFGAYYINNGQNAKDLLKAFFQPAETDELFQTAITTDTVLRKGNVAIGGVLQAFQKAFTPMGDTTFTGRQIDLQPLKIDVSEYPDVLTRTWAGFLTSIAEADRSKWPFVRWWLEQYVLPRSVQDWELTAVFAGEKGNVVPGTALPAAQAIDGIRILINNEITGTGDMNPILLGPPPVDPVEFVEYMEAFEAAIPKIYQPYLQNVAFSDTLFRRFKKGMRAKYNGNYDQLPLVKIADSNLAVKGYASHEGSDKIWTTVKGNAVLGIRKPQLQSVFEVEKVDRQVKAYTDFDKGMGFWRPDLVWTNDVDLS